MAGGTLSDYLSRVDERQWRDKVYPMGVRKWFSARGGRAHVLLRLISL
jgi:hypothetical protein